MGRGGEETLEEAAQERREDLQVGIPYQGDLQGKTHPETCHQGNQTLVLHRSHSALPQVLVVPSQSHAFVFPRQRILLRVLQAASFAALCFACSGTKPARPELL